MPRVIFKCPYLKGGSERAASHLHNYVRYMATREGAQHIPPEHCPTGRSEIKVSMTNISYRAAIPLLLTGNCLTGHRHC